MSTYVYPEAWMELLRGSKVTMVDRTDEELIEFIGCLCRDTRNINYVYSLPSNKLYNQSYIEVSKDRGKTWKPVQKKVGGMSVCVEKITNCARCKEEHADLVFEKLTFPCGEFTHWSTCPTNAEPILMMFTIDEDPKEKINET